MDLLILLVFIYLFHLFGSARLKLTASALYLGADKKAVVFLKYLTISYIKADMRMGRSISTLQRLVWVGLVPPYIVFINLINQYILQAGGNYDNKVFRK